ncbi:PKD domain-containing protein [candidate division KSB1 bacterium]|nr:PKD domain-containing protein [candidate division KSB1 bacterium]
MMNRKSTLILLGAIVILLSSFSAIGAQTYFNTCLGPGQNPFMPMNIYVVEIMVDGLSLQVGDEVGVFTHDNRNTCIGFAVVDDLISVLNPLEIKPTTDDGDACGFNVGDSIVFKILQANFSRLIEVKPGEIVFTDETGSTPMAGVYRSWESIAARITVGSALPPVNYTLTMAINTPAGGQVTPTVGPHLYTAGQMVALSAVPNPGYNFLNWTGSVSDPSNPNTTVLMDANKTVTANFVLDTPAVNFILTVAINTVAGGQVTPSPGPHVYTEGQVVNLSAVANAGYRFLNWTGIVADPLNANTTVLMDANKTVTANFVVDAAPITYTLTMAVDPLAGGQVNPIAGQHVYAAGQIVAVSANPQAGYTFQGWTGDVADPSNPNTTVVMNANKAIVANFLMDVPVNYTLTIATDPAAGGVTNPIKGQHVYTAGQVVAVGAAAQAGYSFLNWSGDVSDPFNPNTTVVMDANKSITANFVLDVPINTEWSNEINVSAGTAPDLDIDQFGNLHIVGLNNGVVYTRMDANGVMLEQQTVPGTVGIPNEWAFGVTVAADLDGNPHVCYRTDAGNLSYNIYYIRRQGGTWGTPLQIAANVLRGHMVRMDIDAANRVHIIHGMLTGDVVGKVKYYRLENGSVVDPQDNLTSYRVDDRVEIDASHPDDVHLILGCPNPGGGPVSYWRSENSGAQINYVGDIHYSGANARNGSPDLFVDASGNVHICYGAGTDTDRNGMPSVRYSRWENGTKVRDVAVTRQGDCTVWKQDLGIASIAASANGQAVIAAYTDTDGGDLYTTLSQNSGVAWDTREFIAANCGGAEARNKHLLRAKGNRFYLVYPIISGIKLRILNMGSANDQLPVANAGGPYQGDVGIAVTLDGSGSYDDHGIVNYSWDFGDGSTGSGETVNHVYQTEDFFIARLTVTDSSGQTSSDDATVIIGDAFSDEWSDPIPVSSGGNTPDFDIHKQSGDLHVVVMKDGVTYIRMDRYGNKLSEEVVPGTQNDVGMMSFGASVAVDSKGYPHVGYRYARGNNYYDLYYIYKTSAGWSNPQKLGNNVLRGYVVRLATDEQDRIYFCHSSVDNTTTNTGPVHMYIIKDGSILLHQNNITQTRGDERYELDVSDEGIVDLIAADLSYPSQGGPIYYWRSSSVAGQLNYRGDFHHPETLGGENGSPDVFVDDAGNAHACYGSHYDRTINRLPSFHYLRLENGTKVRDVRVTDEGELLTWKFGLGIGSIAASSDGNTVVAAYLKTLDSELRTRISQDGGATWSGITKVSDGWDTAEMRNKHIVRANGNAFYLIYPENGIKLRIMGNPPMPGPSLAVNPSTVEFGSALTEATVTVRNSGSNVLNWNLVEPLEPWITGIFPTSGVLAAGQSETFTIYVDRSFLSDGRYESTIVINSNGGNVNLPVYLQVGGPTAWFINCGGPAYTDAQGDLWQADQPYSAGGYGYIGGSTYSTTDPISNTDSDPLYKTERYEMSQYQFDVPNGDYEITLHFAEIYYNYLGKRVFSVTIEGLLLLDQLDLYRVAGHDAAVSYTFSTRDLGFSVTDNNLNIGFTNITDVAKISAIKVEKLPPRGPILSITPQVLNLGRTVDVDTFRVTNSGEDTLRWSVDGGYASWITSIQPQSGSLLVGDQTDVYVTIDRSGLPEGTYNETLSISSNGGTKLVSVVVEVYVPSPVLHVTPATLDFGNFLEQMNGFVKNIGDMNLSYTINQTGLPGWIVLITPTQGVVAPGDSASVLFQVNRAGFADGSYEVNVPISSDGGMGSVQIIMYKGSVTAWRVNCGGSEHLDEFGNQWSADQAYEPGGFGYVGGNAYQTLNPIVGTVDDPIYQTERYGMPAYRFDVPNGDYEVILHFAEIYYSAADKRLINVALEGDPVLTQFDIYEEASGKNQALKRTFSTRNLGMTVTDNRIDLDFSATVDLAKISGIEVVPLQPLGPELSIAPDTLDFGRTKVNETLIVSNTGENPLNWQLTSGLPAWLTSVNPSNGNLNVNGSQAVAVQVSRDGLPEGNYFHVLQFTSNGGNVSIPVMMEVRLPGPELQVDPLLLSYKSYVNSQILEISNIGDMPLTWSIPNTQRPAWVSQVQPNTGQLAPLGTVQVLISVNRTGLVNGVYAGVIRVESDGGNQDVLLELNVGNVDGWRINCGGQDFIDNEGKTWSADRAYSAGSFGYLGGQTYATTNPISGTVNDPLYQTERYGMEAYQFDVPNGDYSVTLHFAEIYYNSVNRRKLNVMLEGRLIVDQLDIFLAAGHDAAYSLTFNTANLGLPIQDNRIDLAFSSSMDMAKISAIEIEPVLPPGPNVVIEPDTLYFPRSAGQQTLVITNSGSEVLVWQVGTLTTPWISSVVPNNGTLNSQQSVVVFVNVNRNDLAQGDYAGMLPIVTNGGNQNIPVIMEVRLPGPELSISPVALDFGYFRTSMNFTISNVGDDTLHWEIPDSARAAWIESVMPATGSLIPGGTQIVNIGITRASQANGIYTSNLFIRSDGGNKFLNLRYNAGNFKINCGGGQVIDVFGKTWLADQDYINGGYGYIGGRTFSTTDPIANTTLDPIYQSEHYGMSEYRIDCPNQDYMITLHFAEIFHTANDRRIMTVTIEGRQVLSNLDIFDEVAHDAALVYTFSTKALGIQISDNVLNIGFSSTADAAKISGIEVSTDAPIGPQLNVTPSELNFGNHLDVMQLTVKNSGDSLLYWNIDTQSLAAWITNFSKTEGLLTANQQDIVTVTVNRTGLADGEYFDVLHLLSTGGNRDVIISLNVGGAISWRVNCGGSLFIDGQSNQWNADQPYAGNDFGYVGGNIYTTTDPIKNTEADVLYQSERYGMTAYRFNVPNGHYLIKLYFAEIYWHVAGKRLFNVKLENTAILRNFDIYQQVGEDFALVVTIDSRNYGIQILDGVLDLTFEKILDEAKLSAIEITSVAPVANDQGNAADAATELIVPTEYKLYQNYPNPFNSSTKVLYDLPEDAKVRVELFNLLGQHVITLLDENVPVGSHMIDWHGIDKFGNSVPSGVYICHIRAGSFRNCIKMMYMK